MSVLNGLAESVIALIWRCYIDFFNNFCRHWPVWLFELDFALASPNLNGPDLYILLKRCFTIWERKSLIVHNWPSVKTGSITSVGEERANLSAVVYLLCGFCLERFPLPLGAWDGLRYFIVALPEPSI